SFLEKVATSMGGSGGCPAAIMACETTFPSAALPMWHDMHSSARTTGSRRLRMPCLYFSSTDSFRHLFLLAWSVSQPLDGPCQPPQRTPSSGVTPAPFPPGRVDMA